MLPQGSHEQTSILTIQKTSQVNLHFFWIRKPFFQLIEDKFNDYIIFKAQYFCDFGRDPRLECVQLNL